MCAKNRTIGLLSKHLFRIHYYCMRAIENLGEQTKAMSVWSYLIRDAFPHKTILAIMEPRFASHLHSLHSIHYQLEIPC